jgi:hypothetical protein
MWMKLTTVLLLGHLVFGRSFAYLGIPPLNLFVGELFLGMFAVSKRREFFGRWIEALKGRRSLRIPFLILTAVLFYGIFQTARGLSSGFDTVHALRNLAVNYYPLFLLAGLWMGKRRPDFLQQFVRILAWTNGIYGFLYVLVLDRIPVIVPWISDTPLFGQPYGSVIAILGLLAFESKPLRVWPLLLLNMGVLMGIQVRAEWLGLAVALVVFAVFGKRKAALLKLASFATLLFLVMSVFHIGLSTPESLAGEKSTEGIAARAVAQVDPYSAAEYLIPRTAPFTGTAAWRHERSREILEKVNGGDFTRLFGLGHGFPLFSPGFDAGSDVRIPHNMFISTLGYEGWIGVLLFFGLQSILGMWLVRLFRDTGRIYGLLVWTAMLASSMFVNFFEEPFGAIPYYLIVGMSLAPYFVRLDRSRSRREYGEDRTVTPEQRGEAL